MPNTPEEILQKLKNKQYSPVYFLQGEETYYIDLISDFIEKNVLSETEKGFNQVVLYGKDTDISKVLLNAKRFPMMSERQVVIVKEAQSILDIEKEGGMKQLEAYVKNPLPSTILCFCFKHKELDGRKSLSKTIAKHAVLLTTKKLYDNQLPAWISDYVRNKNLSISQKAVMLLSEFIGADLSRLANEIDKLTINLQPSQAIDELMVQENVGISKEYNIFELQSALISRDVLKANRIIQYFESNPKNNPLIPNISMLFSFFSKLLCVHMLPDKSDAAVTRFFNNRAFIAKDYLRAIRTFSIGKTIEIIHYLREADLQVKGISGNYSEAEILKELVFKIIHEIPDKIYSEKATA